jgi:DNA-binding IclR family transcriptional regulator
MPKELKMKKPIEKTIQSVDRALMILDQFSLSEKEIGLSDLANRIGLKRTTCYGLAETLLAKGYLGFNESTSRYRLGIKTFEIGQIYSQGVELRDIAKPHIQSLSDKYGQTVHLVIYDDCDAVYIDKVGEHDSFRIRSRIGMRAERYCTAVSKVILSHLSDTRLNQILSNRIKKYTDNTIDDPKTYREELRRIHRMGYAVDKEEFEIGLICIAAPVYNCGEKLIGAISMSGSTFEMIKNAEQAIIDTKSAAANISKLTGE